MFGYADLVSPGSSHAVQAAWQGSGGYCDCLHEIHSDHERKLSTIDHQRLARVELFFVRKTRIAVAVKWFASAVAGDRRGCLLMHSSPDDDALFQKSVQHCR